LVGLNGFDGAATTRRHMLTLRDSPYGTPGGIAEVGLCTLNQVDP
jgi:hypothetical protein